MMAIPSMATMKLKATPIDLTPITRMRPRRKRRHPSPLRRQPMMVPTAAASMATPIAAMCIHTKALDTAHITTIMTKTVE
jgi:hypothetical protein